MRGRATNVGNYLLRGGGKFFLAGAREWVSSFFFKKGGGGAFGAFIFVFFTISPRKGNGHNTTITKKFSILNFSFFFSVVYYFKSLGFSSKMLSLDVRVDRKQKRDFFKTGIKPFFFV